MATTEPAETMPVVVIVYPCGCIRRAWRAWCIHRIGWTEGEWLKTCERCRVFRFSNDDPPEYHITAHR